MKKLTRRIVAILLVAVMVMGLSFSAMAAPLKTQNSNINVYVTVERTLIANQDPILAPTKVSVPSGSTVVDVLDAVKAQVGSSFDYTMTGSVAADTAYIKGFKVPSHVSSFNWETDYEFADEYDEATDEMGFIYWEYGCYNPPRYSDYLTASDYNMFGGWIVSQNNTITWDDDATDTNEAIPRASSAITENNTVLRFEYSCALCRDCGYDGWDMLTPDDQAEAFYTAADKSALVRVMADSPSKTSTAYINGMTVLKNMTATDAEVTAAVAAFQ